MRKAFLDIPGTKECIFTLKCHRILCLAHHLERADNNSFSRPIGPTHTNKYGKNKLARCSSCILQFGESNGDMKITHRAFTFWEPSK